MQTQQISAPSTNAHTKFTVKSYSTAVRAKGQLCLLEKFLDSQPQQSISERERTAAHSVSPLLNEFYW